MAASKEYLALKNFLHNTCGVSREEIKGIVKEAVKEMVRDAVARRMATVEGQSSVREAVFHYLKWHINPLRDAIYDMVEIKVKDPKAGG